MKKILNICIAFLLLFSTVGVAISKHYCGEVLQKITINGEHKCCDSQDMPDDCCSDDTDVLKTEDYKLSQLFPNLEFSPVLLYTLTLNFLNIDQETADQKSISILLRHPPPPNQDIYIRIHSFLI